MSPDEITWHKSSYSGGNGGDCVEAAYLASGKAMIRDSRHPGLGHVAVSASEWRAFLDAAKREEL